MVGLLRAGVVIGVWAPPPWDWDFQSADNFCIKDSISNVFESVCHFYNLPQGGGPYPAAFTPSPRRIAEINHVLLVATRCVVFVTAAFSMWKFIQCERFHLVAFLTATAHRGMEFCTSAVIIDGSHVVPTQHPLSFLVFFVSFTQILSHIGLYVNVSLHHRLFSRFTQLRHVLLANHYDISHPEVVGRYVACDLELWPVKNSFCAFLARLKTYTHTKN